jgi:hypothetical protein
MSENIAQLGITVTTNADKAATDLNSLSTAAKATSAAVASLQTAAAPATTAIANLSKASNDNAEGLRGQRNVLRGLTSDLALLSPGLGGTAAALAAIYIENSHVAEGFSGLRAAIGELITPQNLLIGGIVALVAGGALALKWVADQEVAFANLADRTGTAATALHSLESAAAFKGINADDFSKSMEKFSELTAQAQDHMGGLAEVFRANSVAAGTLEENFSKAADLIKNAKDSASQYAIIQQMGLPPTAAWVELLRQGSVGIASARAEASALGGELDASLVQRAKDFSEAWNKSWSNFTNDAKKAVLGTYGLFESLKGWANSALEGLGVNVNGNLAMAGKGSQIDYGPKITRGNILNTGPGTDKGPTIDKDAQKNELEQEMPRITLLGSLTPVAAAKTAPEPKEADRECDRVRKAA